MTPIPPEVQQIIDAAPAGSTVRVTVRTTPGETVSGEAVGPSASVVGDKLSQSFTGSAPILDLGGGVRVTGGAYTRSISADAFTPAESPWSTPLPWIGVAAIVGAAALRYFGLSRLAGYAAVLGLALIGIAYFPGVALLLAGAAALVAFWPMIRAELAHRRQSHSFATVLAAVESLPQGMRDEVKQAVAKKADRPFVREEVQRLKKRARIGKYQGGS